MTFAKPSYQNQNSQPAREFSYNCAAHGCPLPGSVGGHESARYCSFHAGRKPDENDKITSAVRSNLWIMDAVHRITTPEQFYKGSAQVSFFNLATEGVIGIVKINNRLDLMPSKIKNRHGIEIDESKNDRAWSARLLDEFSKAIHKASSESSEGEYSSAKAPHPGVVAEFANRLAA